jgi:hypothetical protein
VQLKGVIALNIDEHNPHERADPKIETSRDDRYSSWKDERFQSDHMRMKRWGRSFRIDPKNFLLNPRNNAPLGALESAVVAIYFASVFTAFELPKNAGGVAGLCFYFFLTIFANHSALLRYSLAIAGVIFPVFCSFFAKDFVANEWVIPMAGVLLQIIALGGFSKLQKRELKNEPI